MTNTQGFTTVQTPKGTTVNCPLLMSYMFFNERGERHGLGLGYQFPNQSVYCTSPGQYSSGGDTPYRAHISSDGGLVQIANADGTVFTFPNSVGHLAPTSGPPSYTMLPQAIEDRNGNKITFADGSNGAFSVTDSAARPLLSSSGFGSTGNTVAVSGLSPYSLAWTSVASNFSVGYTATGPHCGTISGYSNPQSVIQSITLPNGEQYQFDYEATYGFLRKITYPNGAYVRYDWGLNPQSDNILSPDPSGSGIGCSFNYDTPAVQHRYVSFDGANEVLQQDFNYQTTWSGGTWMSKSTTVTTTVRAVTNGALQTVGSFVTSYTYSSISLGHQPFDHYPGTFQIPVEQSIVYKDFNGQVLRTVTKTWQNPYLLTSTQTALDDGSTSKTAYNYTVIGGQLTQQLDYDFGQGIPGGLLKETVINYQTFSNTPIYSYGPSIVDRPCQVITYDGSGTNRVAETDYQYDGGSTICGSPGASSTTPVNDLTGHDEANYGSGSTAARGNFTQKLEQFLQASTTLTWNYGYDETGQVITETDPKGNSTSYSYADRYTVGTPSGQTNTYLTTITRPNTGVNHIEIFAYRYADGQLASSVDQNSQQTSYLYNDSLGRLTETDYPDGGQTIIGYNDAAPSVTATERLSSSGNPGPMVKTVVMDGLGHSIQTQLNSDPAGADYTEMAYDGLGRIWKTSNPHRSTPSSSDGITTNTYDALGRATSVSYPDGNVASMAYSGSCTTVTDEQGKVRKSCTDALGRITKVYEDPNGFNYLTTYTYDALDNLSGVNQRGQTRTFTYDSLSRLTQSTNPESGTITYTYDGNGNVLSKTAPMPNQTNPAVTVTTAFGYDALNRLTSKTYSDGTPTTLFGYDIASITMGTAHFAINNTIGQMSWSAPVTASGPITMDSYSYDAVGRVTDYWQCTPYNCSGPNPWHTHYTYDLAGDVANWTHPSGVTFTNNVNSAMQVTQISSSQDDSTHPGNLIPNISYTPFGALKSLQDGCAGSNCTLQETYDYNNRLQPARIQLGTSANNASDFCLAYNYYLSLGSPGACSTTLPPQGGGNNGNVMGYLYQDFSPFALTYSTFYNFDPLNRLTQSVASGAASHNLTFGYDPWGNMRCTGGAGICTQVLFDTSSNRINSAGYSYDAAGNLLQDPNTVPATNYTWDAEGRLTAMTENGTTYFTNIYNSRGQVVEAVYPGFNSKVEGIFDPSGRELGHYDGVNNAWWDTDVWAAGRMVAQLEPADTYFLHANYLHSNVQVTDHSGTVRLDMLYYPWGQVWQYSGHLIDAHFAGFQQAAGTFYTTPTRRYSNVEGRWFTPDPKNAGSDPGDPQSWNAYSYSRNNPVTFIDPSGMVDCAPTANCSSSETFTVTTTLHLHWWERLWNWLSGGGGAAATIRLGNSRQYRAAWEKVNPGQKFPTDAQGNNLHADHNIPIADGGDPLDGNNITPRTREEHIERHRLNGDSKRWGARGARRSALRAQTSERLSPDVPPARLPIPPELAPEATPTLPSILRPSYVEPVDPEIPIEIPEVPIVPPIR
jgi:RHS repeat-associated protein